ncbi:hypothetical protein M8J76_006772 [Diaphorina citri]|nr:hypothetical protein M8J76_006772 [Diaphorina citri]
MMTHQSQVTRTPDDPGVAVSEGCSTGSENESLKMLLEKAIENSQMAIEPDVKQSDLMSTIRKECSLFETNGTRGYYLTKVYNFLRSVPPTSVEAERAFSAAGYIQNKLRSRLGDESIDNLLFLRAHFQKLKGRKK